MGYIFFPLPFFHGPRLGFAKFETAIARTGKLVVQAKRPPKKAGTPLPRPLTACYGCLLLLVSGIRSYSATPPTRRISSSLVILLLTVVRQARGGHELFCWASLAAASDLFQLLSFFFFLVCFVGLSVHA